MKMMLGFIVGAIFGALILGGLLSPMTASADSAAEGMLPDVERIYREALLSPLYEAGQEIEDEQIAKFYQGLLERSGLDGS